MNTDVCRSDDDVPLPQNALDTPRRKRKSGGDKRRERNALPKAVFVYEPSMKCITGAMIVCTCFQITDSSKVRFSCSRAVPLAERFQVTQEMKAYSGSVFKLLVEHETQCKEQEVRVGGHLYNHFSEFLLQQWR
eukprot:4604157-Pyramimonas_sp.AAC.1